MSKQVSWLLVVGMFAVGSCASDTSSLLIDDGEMDARRDERVRRMALTVVSVDDGEYTATAESFATSLRVQCSDPAQWPPAWVTLVNRGDACSDALRDEIFIEDCVAQHLLEASEAETPTVYLSSIEVDTGLGQPTPIYGGWTLPPQLPEARIALARQSALVARNAITAAGDTLRYHGGQNAADDVLASRVLACDVYKEKNPTQAQLANHAVRAPLAGAGFVSVTPLALIAEVLTGSTVTMDRAADVEIHHQVSVAEAERSRSSSTVTASSLSWVDPVMSRATIAKHLIGGAGEGLFGYEAEEGMCPVPPPEGDVVVAMDFLAALGGDTRRLLDLDVGLSDLLFAGGNPYTDVITEMNGGGDPINSVDGFIALAGVSESSFAAARLYLRHEARAFATQPLLIDGGIPLSPSTGGERHIDAWASTLRRPIAPPTIFSAAMATFGGPLTVIADGKNLNNPVTAAYASRAVAHTLDYSYSVATDFGVFGGGEEPSSEYLALPKDSRERLAVLVETGADRIPARVQFCRNGGSAYRTDLLYRANNFITTPGDLVVVRGVSGLRCAVEGSVQGEPCDLADFELGRGTYSGSFSSTERATGIHRYAYGAHSIPALPPLPSDALPQEIADRDLIFALRRVRGTGNPGDYEALASHRLGATDNQCTMTPVIPEYLDRIEEILTPSEQFCATAAITCAGPAYADRIPLENEITGDDGGQGLENSWQYWLDLAEESADRADALGERLLTSGEILDESLEGLEQRVGAICGGTVNLADAFFDRLGEAPAGPCPCADETTHTCQDGYCVRNIEDLLAGEEYRDLRECIGDASIVDFAAAGTRPLCVWKRAGDPGICGRADMDTTTHPCPWFAEGPEDAPTCSTPMNLPAMAMVLPPITRTLEIFETEAPPIQPEMGPPGPFDCNVIRSLRMASPAARQNFAAEIAASPQFSRENLQRVANDVGYIAFPDDYGRITQGNHRWRGLGSPQDPGMDGENTEWPCARDSDVLCSGASGDVAAPGLFCASTDFCGATGLAQRVNRAYMNHRMARAVMALKLLTGTDLNRVELPFRPEPRSLTTEADTENYRESTRLYNELEAWSWELQDGSESFALRTDPLVGVRDLLESDGLLYRVTEQDGGNDDDGELPIEGRAYCTVSGAGDGWTWTHFPHLGEDWEGDVRRIYTPCDHEGERFLHADGAFRTPPEYYDEPATETQGVAYLPLSGANRAADPDARSQMWRGMGGTAAPRRTSTIDGSSLISLSGILFEGGEGYIAEAPYCGWTDDGYKCNSLPFTDYWNAGNNEANRYNDIRVMDDGITRRDFVDALELACEVQADNLEDSGIAEETNCDDWDAMFNDSVSNLRQAQKLVACLAQEVEERGQRQIFQDIPEAAIENLISTRTPPGQRGEQITNITQQLRNLAAYPDGMASILRDVGLLLQQARLAAARNDTRQELNAVDQQSTQFREVTSCIASGLRAAGQAAGASAQNPAGAGAGGLFVAASVVDCANSVAQVVFAKLQEGLRNDLSTNETETELSALAARLGANIDAMKALSRSAADAQDSLRGSLATMESNRDTILGEIADALTIHGNTSAVSTIRRRNFNTLHERYKEAQFRAIDTAWLARRALEQRIGRNLGAMVDDLPLVNAPSEWADELCVMGGMNYQRISRDYSLPGGDNYAREYVGDYVRQLRAVFDSYSVAHPFVTGDDTAVVSMRDDVVNARQECSTPVRNLLAFSGDLNISRDPNYIAPIAVGDEEGLDPVDRTPPPIWEHVGCVPQMVTVGGELVERIDGCIGFERLGDPADAPLPATPELGAPTGWRVRFGGPARVGNTSYVGGVRVAQRVVLAAGSYRLSWRGRMVDVDPRLAFTIHDATGNELSHVRMATAYPVDGWDQYYLFFSLSADAEVDIVLTPNDPSGTAAATPLYMEVAAPMLENVTGELGFSTAGLSSTEHLYPPFPYIETREPGVAALAVCEDTDGSVFQTHWQRGCTTLCAGGGEGCTEGRRACYWELPFSISQNDLEYGGQLAHAGFANGNYNYRWNTLSANVVGTGVRNCEGSTSPSTCFGSGYVPISLYHDNGFQVRNQWGELYDAPLFEGRVEHARALNAERYITNPISGADRALIEPYSRYEMRGRPLAGNYRMRIWDEAGIRFDRVEDVQIVMGYRYWTRLD